MKGDNIFLLLSQYLGKELVLMNVHKCLNVTYDNDGCDFCYRSFYSSYLDFKKTQIKEKDNRPATNIAVIF